MNKHQQNLADVIFIVEDFNRFALMSIEDFRQYLDEHRGQGGLGDIGHYAISRESSQRFTNIAKRQLEIDAKKESLELHSLERAIREIFLEMFVVQKLPIERKWVDRMLTRAASKAKADHKATTHYLPCVIMTDEHPQDFQIGPVRFISTTKFFSDFQEKIEADLNTIKERWDVNLNHLTNNKMDAEQSARMYQQLLDWIYEYYKGYAWIAEVAVPACDDKISRERAEVAAQSALDVLKLFFGRAGGKRMRLAQDRGRPDKTAHLKCGDDGAFKWEIGGYGKGGAPAAKGWFDRMMGETYWAVEAAGGAITGYLTPEVKSDHRDRWLDALNWYGQAVSEQLPTAQIVKYVAALERLTITGESGSEKVTDIVTRRTALLSVMFDADAELAKALDNSRKIYRWRSDLMHGRRSPLTKEVLALMRLADSITQDSLFGALALFIDLEMQGKHKSKDLEQCFEELERQLPKGPVQAKGDDRNTRRLNRAVNELKAAEKRIRSKRALEQIRHALVLINDVQKRGKILEV